MRIIIECKYKLRKKKRKYFNKRKHLNVTSKRCYKNNSKYLTMDSTKHNNNIVDIYLIYLHKL